MISSIVAGIAASAVQLWFKHIVGTPILENHFLAIIFYGTIWGILFIAWLIIDEKGYERKVTCIMVIFVIALGIFVGIVTGLGILWTVSLLCLSILLSMAFFRLVLGRSYKCSPLNISVSLGVLYGLWIGNCLWLVWTFIVTPSIAEGFILLALIILVSIHITIFLIIFGVFKILRRFHEAIPYIRADFRQVTLLIVILGIFNTGSLLGMIYREGERWESLESPEKWENCFEHLTAEDKHTPDGNTEQQSRRFLKKDLIALLQENSHPIPISLRGAS